MMKRILIPLAAAILALAAVAGCGGMYEPASYATSYDAVYADESTFYGALAPYGDWIRSDRYGLVWSPYDKVVDWRPYTDGEWIWTDYGWTWAADEDWGWAPYHYGRWYDDPYDGWCWVPGRQWAPAWVAWREGGGWVGWAPLPPELTWQDGRWLNNNDWDRLPGVEHYWWSFCRERDLPGPGIQRRLAPRHRAVVLINETRNVTRYTSDNARVTNRSLDVAAIRRATGKDIATRRIADLAAPPDRTGSAGRQVTRDTYRAFRPRLREPEADTPPPNVRPSRPSPTRADEVIRTPEVTRTPRVTREPQDAEARALERRENADRERMQRDQRREDRQAPDGVEAERLRRQHEEEQKALADQAERDRRVLRSRQENSPPDPQDARKRAQPPVKSNRRGG